MASQLTTQTAVEAALLRPLTAAEDSYVMGAGGLVDQVSSLLRTAAPSIDDRISRYETDPTDKTGVDPLTVSSVLAGVIKKYMANPRGLTSTTDAQGPYSHSESYALRGDKETRGALQITSDDLAVLFPTRRRLRAGTIRTRPALAPRPVGRYGPIPTPAQAIDAAITYDRHFVPDAEFGPIILDEDGELEYDAGEVYP